MQYVYAMYMYLDLKTVFSFANITNIYILLMGVLFQVYS